MSAYYNPHDPTHVLLLCDEHAAKAEALGWQKGFGALAPFEPMPGACAVCRGTADLDTIVIEPVAPRVGTVRMDGKAVTMLRAIAAEHGVSLRAYMEALANYAISCNRRPGSWEATQPFDFEVYDKRGETFADTWF